MKRQYFLWGCLLVFIAPIVFLFIVNIKSWSFSKVSLAQILQLLAIVLLSFYVVQRRSDMRVKAEIVEKIALKALNAYQMFCEESRIYLQSPKELSPDERSILRASAYIQVKSTSNYYDLVNKVAQFKKSDKEMMYSLLSNWQEVNEAFGEMIANDPKTNDFLSLLRKNTPLIEHKTYCIIVSQYQK